MSLTHPTDRPAPTSRGDFATIGATHLDVTNRQRSLAFWRDLIGLQVRAEDADTVSLGTPEQTLLVLHPMAIVAAHPGHAGLYHVAIHPPNEAAFAVLLGRLLDRLVPISPSDHTFSKAIYLSDPDRLGVELTLETPERGTDVSVGPGGPSILDATGRRLTLAEPLDLDEILAHLPDTDVESPLPTGTTIGHVHLRVSQLEPAQCFYQDQLGLLEHFGIPGVVSNLHTGGAFPHRLAINTFNGTGLTPAPSGMARLRSYTIRYANPERLGKVLQGLPDATEHPDGALVTDPSGNAIILTS